MKIGYSSRWLFTEDREMDIFEELEYAHSLGFEVFGLNLDRDQNRRLSETELRRLGKQAAGYDMGIVVRSPHHLNTSMEDETVVPEVARDIEIARLVGSDRLMLHPGHIFNVLQLDFKTSQSYKGKGRSDFGITESKVKKQFQQLVSNLREIVIMGKRVGIQIALENNGEYYQFGSNATEYGEILSQVNGLKASLSTGHAHISGNTLQGFVKKCKARIINLDLHDNHGVKDEHLPVGGGTIDFSWLLRQVRNTNHLTVLIDTYTNDFVERSLSNLRTVLETL